ncbi:Uu.00g064010.m01.CDS01 [Anthostomella pinea]|uniref:Uu.00g064010.m01.CDS01 n=1 Tax=Anthostomella pinea TaxID=933095 RepID=A0AAI8YN62_9PEZI|nr:Uu.00g064010.m01.CDS01 [Anthostomella pinea]
MAPAKVKSAGKKTKKAKPGNQWNSMDPDAKPILIAHNSSGWEKELFRAMPLTEMPSSTEDNTLLDVLLPVTAEGPPDSFQNTINGAPQPAKRTFTVTAARPLQTRLMAARYFGRLDWLSSRPRLRFHLLCQRDPDPRTARREDQQGGTGTACQDADVPHRAALHCRFYFPRAVNATPKVDKSINKKWPSFVAERNGSMLSPFVALLTLAWAQELRA